MSSFEKFPSINNFHSVNRTVGKFWNMEARPTIRYRPKYRVVALEASIHVSPEGEVTAHGRKKFCEWVGVTEEYWATLKKESRTVVYGSWGAYTFSVHSALFGKSSILFDPNMLQLMFGEKCPEAVSVSQWSSNSVEIDFKDMKNVSVEDNYMYIPVNIEADKIGPSTKFSDEGMFKTIDIENFKNFAFET